MRLFILMLSVTCVVCYGYALAGYAAYAVFGRGTLWYSLLWLAAGTLAGAASLFTWKKWMKDSAADLLVFDVDGVLLGSDATPGTSRNWKDLALPVGIYTGRTREEAAEALGILNWHDFPVDMLICGDDIIKPSPEGLAILCQRVGAKWPVFFGDTPNDLMAWEAFGHGDFVAIGPVLKPESKRGKIFHFDALEEALSALYP